MRDTHTYTSPKALDTLELLRRTIAPGTDFLTSELQELVGISRAGISRYLRRLTDLGEIHSTPSIGSALLWRHGPAPALGAANEYSEDDEKDTSPATRKIIPAAQIGMWRDSLVSALFGQPGPQVIL